MPINKQMTTQTGQSDYARHMRGQGQQRQQRMWSPSHNTGRGGGNRK
jgi:hypothetical protein